MKVNLISERRATNREREMEAQELIGEPGKPSGLVSGKGYNYNRFKKEMSAAEREQEGGRPWTSEEMPKVSATGMGKFPRLGRFDATNALNLKKSKLGRAMGRKLLTHRARTDVPERGYLQDIEGMSQQMKDNPDAFPPSVSLTPDPRNPHHQKETQVGGRTRNVISLLTKGKPHKRVILPSSKYADSARRAKKWISSGKAAKRMTELGREKRQLRGQDWRLHPRAK